MDQDLLQRAWAAGFLDGEGCISVVDSTTARSQRRQIQLLLDCGQAKPEPLEELVRLFGGRVRPVNGRRAYSWRLYGQKAGRVLEAILPYLVVKRAQALLGLELLSLHGVQGKRRTESAYQRSLEIYAQFRVLNQRQPVHAERLSESAPEIALRVVR